MTLSQLTVSPEVCILIPTIGNAGLCSDAIASAARQSYKNVRILVSDNSGGETIQNSIASMQSYVRHKITYVRAPQQMSFADHWQWALEHVESDLLTILTERSVLVPSALEIAVKQLLQANADCITYGHGHYYTDTQQAIYRRQTIVPTNHEASELLRLFISAPHQYDAICPRGMNSIISTQLLRKCIGSSKQAFAYIPDYGIAYRVLANISSVTHIPAALYLLQGHEFSTGRQNRRGDHTVIEKTIGRSDLPGSPKFCSQIFDSNLIFGELDYAESTHPAQGTAKTERLSGYITACRKELLEKTADPVVFLRYAQSLVIFVSKVSPTLSLALMVWSLCLFPVIRLRRFGEGVVTKSTRRRRIARRVVRRAVHATDVHIAAGIAANELFNTFSDGASV